MLSKKLLEEIEDDVTTVLDNMYLKNTDRAYELLCAVQGKLMRLSETDYIDELVQRQIPLQFDEDSYDEGD
jgi:hypothetical protein